MPDYTYDDQAEKLSLLGEPEKPASMRCPADDTEMNYHIATDQWQCPMCLGAVPRHNQDGGKPQSESTDEQHVQPGTGNQDL